MKKIVWVFFVVLIFLAALVYSFNSEFFLNLNNKEVEIISPQASVKKSINFAHPSPSPNKKFTLVATGDVGLVRTVNFKMKNNSVYYPFEKTADLLKSADLTLINLEGPLIKNCPITNEGMIFCGAAENVKGLSYAGIDIANLANNHIYNYGKKGLAETIDILEKNGIDYSGINNLLVKEIKGTKIAFLGYNIVGIPGNKEKIIEQIKEAENSADITVVSFHWGNEYAFEPNWKQKEFAHLAIDNGSDLIIGNHPHVVQSNELYKNKLIVYAHGNFIFDQMWSEKTREGVIGKYYFDGSQLVDYEFIPVYIKDYSQPEIVKNAQKKEKILSRLKLNSN